MTTPLPKEKRWLLLILLAAPFLVLAALWDRFPAQLAMPWLRYGQANTWPTKAGALLFFPLLNVGVALLLAVLPRVDPKLRRNYRVTQTPGIKGPGFIAACFAGVFSFISLVVAATALGYDVNAHRLAISASLVLFMVVGNRMGTLRPNYSFGLRTPWTLRSEEVWRATHRIGGRIVVAGALILFALQFVVSNSHFKTVLYAAMGAEFAWAFLYSYWRSRSAPGASQMQAAE